MSLVDCVVATGLNRLHNMKQPKQAKVATGQTIRDKAKERAALNRDVVKPVFASPFTVPW